MDKKLAEIKQVWVERGFNEYIPVREFKRNEIQAPIYRLIWAIMVNDIETVKRLIGTGEIDLNQEIFDYLLFAPFKLCRPSLGKGYRRPEPGDNFGQSRATRNFSVFD